MNNKKVKREENKKSFSSNFEVYPIPATRADHFLINPLALTRASADPIQ
jgi:hypothetical protein